MQLRGHQVQQYNRLTSNSITKEGDATVHQTTQVHAPQQPTWRYAPGQLSAMACIDIVPRQRNHLPGNTPLEPLSAIRTQQHGNGTNGISFGHSAKHAITRKDRLMALLKNVETSYAELPIYAKTPSCNQTPTLCKFIVADNVKNPPLNTHLRLKQWPAWPADASTVLSCFFSLRFSGLNEAQPRHSL